MTSPLIDFTELASHGTKGEGLELLVERIARRLGLNPQPSGRGGDRGKDLLISERYSGVVASPEILWLVSCKDHAAANKSVGEDELPGSLENKLAEHKAHGFLLVTTTVPSTNCRSALDAFAANNLGRCFVNVWNKGHLYELLTRPENHDTFKEFLPLSYARYAALTPTAISLKALEGFMPATTLNQILETLQPFETAKGLAAQLFAPDPSSVNSATEAITKLLAEEDPVAAWEAANKLEPEQRSLLIEGLHGFVSGKTWAWLQDVVIQSDLDESKRLAFEELLRVSKSSPLRFTYAASYLDSEDIKDIYSNLIINEVVELAMQESLAFSSDLQAELVPKGESYYISALADVTEVEVTVSDDDERLISFEGTLQLDIEIDCSGDGDVLVNRTLEGHFSGRLDFGIEIEDAGVDIEGLDSDDSDDPDSY